MPTIIYLAVFAHILLVIHGAPLASTSATCAFPNKKFRDPSSTNASTNCFRLNPRALDWPHARVACQLWGGDLATISSDAERQFVDAFWNETWRRVWIGMHGIEAFEWSTKEDGRVTHIPASHDGHYPSTCVYLAGNMVWNSTSCSEVHVSVCERPAGDDERSSTAAATPASDVPATQKEAHTSPALPTTSKSSATDAPRTPLFSPAAPNEPKITNTPAIPKLPTTSATPANVPANNGANGPAVDDDYASRVSCDEFVSYGVVRKLDGMCYFMGGADGGTSRFLSWIATKKLCTSVPNGNVAILDTGRKREMAKSLHAIAYQKTRAHGLWADLQRSNYLTDKDDKRRPIYRWFPQCGIVSDTELGFLDWNTTMCDDGATRFSYICQVNPCKAGMTVVPSRRRVGEFVCAVDNVCDINNIDCGAGRCIDQQAAAGVGHYKCACNSGYKNKLQGVEQSRCVVRRDCEDETRCAQKSTGNRCLEQPHLYKCICGKGFERVSGTQDNEQCVQIDECKRQPDMCGAGGVCIKAYGGFGCKCRPGFQMGQGYAGCVKI